MDIRKLKNFSMMSPKSLCGRGRLIVQAVIVLVSITNNYFATASLYSPQLPTLMDAPRGSIEDITLYPPKTHITDKNGVVGQRRWLLSKIAHIRGGSSSSKRFRQADFVLPSTTTNNLHETQIKALSQYPKDILRNRGGSFELSPIVSMVLLVINQSINVASAAFIASGYFGACLASWMIQKMHNLLPFFTKKAAESRVNSSSRLQKYTLTTLATVGFLLLHITGIQANSVYSRMSDATFVAILWIYSHLVNPLLGGMIGCTHVSLGILSNMLGNQKLINYMDHLGDFRLKKLDDESTSSGDEHNNVFKAAVANMLGSASLLISFPQYFMGLYMLGSTLVSLSSSHQYAGRMKGFVQWLSQEICVSYDENGKLDCGIDTISTENVVNPWQVSKRLVALYWIIAGVKTVVTLVLA